MLEKYKKFIKIWSQEQVNFLVMTYVFVDIIVETIKTIIRITMS